MSTCTAPHTADPGLLEHYVKKILAAPVYDLAVRTPLQAAPACPVDEHGGGGSAGDKGA